MNFKSRKSRCFYRQTICVLFLHGGLEKLPRYYCLLGKCFFEKCAPEFVGRFGFGEDKFSVFSWQLIVDDDIDPAAESPELEVEYARVTLWLFRIPFLIILVGNHLKY